MRRNGFTLIELLVTITLLGIAAAAVSLSVSRSDSRLLREEALRLAALFRIAQDEARVSGRTLLWEANLSGYRFRVLDADAGAQWQNGQDGLLRPRAWPFTVKEIDSPRIVFGREPLLEPVTLRLVTDERATHLVLDAFGNLTLTSE
jgi:general secretion pathway protein H